MKKIILPVFFCLAAIPLFADYNAALKLFTEGKYDDSLKIIGEDLDAAKDMNPDSPNYKLRFLAGHNHWKMKRYENALSHLGRCLQIRPNDTNTMIDVGLVYLEMKKYADAVRVGQKIAEKEKNNAMAYYIIGKARYGLGNFWGAKELLEKATSADFELYPAWNELGKTFMMLKKYPEAEIAFATAYSINPASPEIMNNFAASYYAQGKKDKAAEMIKKAAEADKSNLTILANFGTFTAK
ncbi:MAG: tetratricopeptide repeat protein [Spirochaetes bacterium]|nr:tetratricopeptide repeat protein [Spirochaetota bacterium]